MKRLYGVIIAFPVIDSGALKAPKFGLGYEKSVMLCLRDRDHLYLTHTGPFIAQHHVTAGMAITWFLGYLATWREAPSLRP